MRELNMKNTKKNLTIAFSVIVFIIVYVLWIVFFSTKYIREDRIDKSNFHKFVKNISNIEVWNPSFNIDSISINRPRLEYRDLWYNSWLKITIADAPWAINFNGFINYLIIDNNQVIVNNIQDDIPEKIILDSVENDAYFDEQKKSSFLVRKLIFKDWKIFIAYKELNYPFSDYLKDIFLFSLILLFFTLLFYVIWSKFVDKIFLPVEKNFKDMNDFIHNAWHELKTPLSVIDSNIQIIKDSKTYNEKMTNELKNEVIKLNSLIDSLVELSNIDIFKDFEDLDLKSIVDEVLSNLKTAIKNKKITVNTKIKENISIKANKNYFYIFLSNIIGNAIKYNKKEGSIDIIYKSWELEIKDTWIWIKKEEIDKIFDRFYKSDISRNSEWFWIWLSLVRKIADIYKWKINVQSEEWKQTSFKIKF